MVAIRETAYMQRLIERIKRVHAATEQIERHLSALADQRTHFEAHAEFFWLLDDLAERAELTARDVALFVEQAIKPNGR